MYTNLKLDNTSLYRNNFIASSVVDFTVSSEDEENYRKLPTFSLNLLLVNQNSGANEEFSLPTTLIKKNENSIQAIQRELKDKSGILKCYIEQLYTFTDFSKSLSSHRAEVLASENFSTISHIALFDNEKENLSEAFLSSQNVIKQENNAHWFKISYTFVKSYYENNTAISEYLLELTNNTKILRATILQKKNEDELDNSVEVSNSSGISAISAQIISYAITRLRGKIEYTDIAFRLLPQSFSIKKLQKIYELILGKNLLDANFRRKILPKLEENEQETYDSIQSLGHRKAKLYSLKKNTVNYL